MGATAVVALAQCQGVGQRFGELGDRGWLPAADFAGVGWCLAIRPTGLVVYVAAASSGIFHAAPRRVCEFAALSPACHAVASDLRRGRGGDVVGSTE